MVLHLCAHRPALQQWHLAMCWPNPLIHPLGSEGHALFGPFPPYFRYFPASASHLEKSPSPIFQLQKTPIILWGGIIGASAFFQPNGTFGITTKSHQREVSTGPLKSLLNKGKCENLLLSIYIESIIRSSTGGSVVNIRFQRSHQRELNSRPPHYQWGAIPLSHGGSEASDWHTQYNRFAPILLTISSQPINCLIW